jgi:hypothetical protein
MYQKVATDHFPLYEGAIPFHPWSGPWNQIITMIGNKRYRWLQRLLPEYRRSLSTLERYQIRDAVRDSDAQAYEYLKRSGFSD